MSIRNAKNFDRRYFCLYCKYIYNQPYQTSCGCRFCLDCLNKTLAIQKNCPICDEIVNSNSNFRDKAFQKELNAAALMCIKCQWIGTFRDYEKHYSNCHAIISGYTTLSTRVYSISDLLLSKELEIHKKKVDKMREEINRLKRELSYLNEKKSQLECCLSQNLSCGRLLWRICNINEKFNKLTRSQPFQDFSPKFKTHVYGYELCGKLELKIDQNGNKYMSVYLIIMKGEFDALLQWPFKQNVSFRLIGNSEQAIIRREYVSDNQQLASFKRPLELHNEPFGVEKFCFYHELTSPGYIEDDCILIQIVVDTKDPSYLYMVI